jgi:uncharacterized protein
LIVLRTIASLIIISVVLVLSGCASLATKTSHYRGTQELIAKRDISAVIRKLETKKSRNYAKKDRVLQYLDLGLLYHYQGDYEKSNLLLEKAEQAMEELYTKSVSKAAISVLLNDNALDYFGEDYEDIYINVFKALNYLHQDNFDAAFVEIRRINLKLSVLEDKHGKMAAGISSSGEVKGSVQTGKNRYISSAVGSYLSMLIYRHEGKTDDAAIDLARVRDAFDTQPEIYNFPPPALPDSLLQTKGPFLNVISLVGTSPYKRSRELHISTKGDFLTVATLDEELDITPIFWPGLDPDLYFKFSLPRIINDPSVVDRVIVRINGEPHELQMLEDIGRVAVQTFRVREPVILLKSISRSIAKGVAAGFAKDEMQKKNPGITGALMSLATDALVFASENADLRTSRFFPNAVLVADIPLSPGEYDITVEYYDALGYLLYQDNKGKVTVSPDSFNFLQSWHLQ